MQGKQDNFDRSIRKKSQSRWLKALIRCSDEMLEERKKFIFYSVEANSIDSSVLI